MSITLRDNEAIAEYAEEESAKPRLFCLDPACSNEVKVIRRELRCYPAEPGTYAYRINIQVATCAECGTHRVSEVDAPSGENWTCGGVRQEPLVRVNKGMLYR